MQTTPDEIYAIEYATCGERTHERRRECAERAKRLHLAKLHRCPSGPVPSEPPPEGPAVSKAIHERAAKRFGFTVADLNSRKLTYTVARYYAWTALHEAYGNSIAGKLCGRSLSCINMGSARLKEMAPDLWEEAAAIGREVAELSSRPRVIIGVR